MTFYHIVYNIFYNQIIHSDIHYFYLAVVCQSFLYETIVSFRFLSFLRIFTSFNDSVFIFNYFGSLEYCSVFLHTYLTALLSINSSISSYFPRTRSSRLLYYNIRPIDESIIIIQFFKSYILVSECSEKCYGFTTCFFFIETTITSSKIIRYLYNSMTN